MELGWVLGVLAFGAVCYGGYRFYKKHLSDKPKNDGSGFGGSGGGSGNRTNPEEIDPQSK